MKVLEKIENKANREGIAKQTIYKRVKNNSITSIKIKGITYVLSEIPAYDSKKLKKAIFCLKQRRNDTLQSQCLSGGVVENDVLKEIRRQNNETLQKKLEILKSSTPKKKGMDEQFFNFKALLLKVEIESNRQ